MTIFLMLQAVLALVVLNVLVSRYAHRRNAAHREQLFTDESAVRQLDYKILEAQRHEHVARQKIEALTDSIDVAERQLALAEKELDAARKAPPDLYYIFDRLEPKPGIIWEVAISRSSDVPMQARTAAAWGQPRRYLIAAKTPKEARDRAAQRFFDKTGLKIDNVVPCPLFAPKRPDGAETAEAGEGAAPSRGARLPARAS